MAYTIDTNGNEKAIEQKGVLPLRTLQELVGGFIEIVPTKDDKLLVLNEEGKLLGLPFNAKATDLYVNGDQDPIVGNVVICEKDEIE